MAINIKNYTTEVAVSKSIESIERLLIDFGAINIMKEYATGGKVKSISFIVEVEGMKMPFRLPAKIDPVFLWLKKKFPQRKDQTLLEQAERVVWKQLWDWTHITLSGVQLDQLEVLEALFPHLYEIDKQQTYYQRVKAGNFKLLTNG